MPLSSWYDYVKPLNFNNFALNFERRETMQHSSLLDRMAPNGRHITTLHHSNLCTGQRSNKKISPTHTAPQHGQFQMNLEMLSHQRVFLRRRAANHLTKTWKEEKKHNITRLCLSFQFAETIGCSILSERTLLRRPRRTCNNASRKDWWNEPPHRTAELSCLITLPQKESVGETTPDQSIESCWTYLDNSM